MTDVHNTPPTSGFPVRRNREAPPKRSTFNRALVVALLALATAVILLPIAIIVFTAFKPAAEVNAFPPTLVPGQWTLDNFARIFQELPFARLIANSFIFAGGVTLFALLFDSLAAYALARIDFTGKKFLLIAIIASLMIPFQATLVPVYQLASDLGWVNSFAALIVPGLRTRSGSSSCVSFSFPCPGIWITRPASTALPSGGSIGTSSCQMPCRPS
ncbi:carbohydrate ABC transporter permease [Arthrobacter sp. SA17]